MTGMVSVLSCGFLPELKSDISWVVLLVLYVLHNFVLRRGRAKAQEGRSVGAVKEEVAEEVRKDLPTAVDPSVAMHLCPGVAACPYTVSSKMRISDSVQLSSLNKIALNTGADSAVLLVAENGSGIPRPGKRAYTSVVKQITVRGEVAPSWVSVQATHNYVEQVISPLCNRGAITIKAEELEDITLRDRYASANPPITESLVLLLDTRTSGLWYISLHFSEGTGGAPKFTPELRTMLRNHGNALISALPGKKTDEGYYGVGSPLCRWGE